eukprot:TRINITY_DN538_c1_g2_i1.p1 TRINITY_DN538_c1_g2~~TRINITY_DN538_c1_g2_i1.p1  ORF type:complete len:452 (+),score=54.52 TRINITY_DN538_c1_g2_i1:48-1358(+)
MLDVKFLSVSLVAVTALVLFTGQRREERTQQDIKRILELREARRKSSIMKIHGNTMVESLTVRSRWSVEEAWAWQKKVGWMIGGNFVPSNAVNQIQMFSEEGFDVTLIEKEIKIAAKKGNMNAMRVFLHNLLFEDNKEAYFTRLDKYLEISARHGVKTIFVFFDACWRATAHLGRQPTPIPHTHNSGWVQCPTHAQLLDERSWAGLKDYVTQTIKRFRNDERVVLWDIYNEPSNTAMEFDHIPQKLTVAQGAANLTMITQSKKKAQVLKLLEKAFVWARSGNPTQPITSGMWGAMTPTDNSPFTKLQMEQSDIVSFHNYDPEEQLLKYIQGFSSEQRPLICTEYLARSHGSTVHASLPVFHAKGISAFHWGVIDGATQTSYPWSSWHDEMAAKPDIWHHDVFSPNGDPHDPAEVELMGKLRETPIDWDAVRKGRFN